MSKLLLAIIIATISGNVDLYRTSNRFNLKYHRKGAVVANGYECAEIGGTILTRGGSAVDAAISTALCEGITLPESLGIGGGFFMTIYDRASGHVATLNARETAPAAATETMFEGNAAAAAKGGRAVAVPGEVRGYWAAHQRYGKLSWGEVIGPVVELCARGHLVTGYLAGVFKAQEGELLKSATLREVFINPETNQTYEKGHLLKRPQLAKTLNIIAQEGADALYDGSLTNEFVKDIQDMNGIITIEDMNNYQPQWHDPIKAKLPNEQTLYSFPLPGSGVILSFIMNILSGYLNTRNLDTVTNWQRIVESFKFGYGKRTELGDGGFVTGINELLFNLTSPSYAESIRDKIMDDATFDDPEYYGVNMSFMEDHGTAHMSILAPNGDAVSITGTINVIFGAGIRSLSTGIILNNEMDDFSSPNITNSYGVPPSPANYIRPGKRPMSSMCPSIVLDKQGNVRLVVGAAGGTKITTSVALTIIRNLWYKIPIKEAISQPRIHHQLFPMLIDIEDITKKFIIDGLSRIGHYYSISDLSNGFSAVTAISNVNGLITASFDNRRGGSIYYL